MSNEGCEHVARVFHAARLRQALELKMAAPTNTFLTTAAIGNREDLTD